MNNKDYRDTVLSYVDKLGEIDKLEDQIINSKGEISELKKKVKELKIEVNELKREIDNHKRRR